MADSLNELDDIRTELKGLRIMLQLQAENEKLKKERPEVIRKAIECAWSAAIYYSATERENRGSTGHGGDTVKCRDYAEGYLKGLNLI